MRSPDIYTHPVSVYEMVVSPLKLQTRQWHPSTTTTSTTTSTFTTTPSTTTKVEHFFGFFWDDSLVALDL